MAKWFYLINGQPDGPIDSAGLKQLAATGRLKSTDRVRREDMAEWHEATKVKGLFPSMPLAATPLPTESVAIVTSANGVEVQQTQTFPRRQIPISGMNNDAIESLREFMDQAYNAEITPNPFRDPKYKFKIVIDEVKTGDAMMRYLTSSITGRPKVSIGFTLEEDGQPVAENRFATSTFFRDRRDIGFMGSAFGGTEVSFIRTNCRKIAKQITEEVATRLVMPESDRKILRKALKGKGDVATLKWMGAWAVVMGLAGAVLGYMGSHARDKLTGILLGLVLGALIGVLVGAVLSVFQQLYLKLRDR